MTFLRRVLAQWKRLGLPRCEESMPDICGHLIWPWQLYVTGYEDGPYHHSCHHGMLVAMKRHSRELPEENFGDPDTWYDECRHCGWVTE